MHFLCTFHLLILALILGVWSSDLIVLFDDKSCSNTPHTPLSVENAMSVFINSISTHKCPPQHFISIIKSFKEQHSIASTSSDLNHQQASSSSTHAEFSEKDYVDYMVYQFVSYLPPVRVPTFISFLISFYFKQNQINSSDSSGLTNSSTTMLFFINLLIQKRFINDTDMNKEILIMRQIMLSPYNSPFQTNTTLSSTAMPFLNLLYSFQSNHLFEQIKGHLQRIERQLFDTNRDASNLIYQLTQTIIKHYKQDFKNYKQHAKFKTNIKYLMFDDWDRLNLILLRAESMVIFCDILNTITSIHSNLYSPRQLVDCILGMAWSLGLFDWSCGYNLVIKSYNISPSSNSVPLSMLYNMFNMVGMDNIAWFNVLRQDPMERKTCFKFLEAALSYNHTQDLSVILNELQGLVIDVSKKYVVPGSPIWLSRFLKIITCDLLAFKANQVLFAIESPLSEQTKNKLFWLMLQTSLDFRQRPLLFLSNFINNTAMTGIVSIARGDKDSYKIEFYRGDLGMVDSLPLLTKVHLDSLLKEKAFLYTLTDILPSLRSLDFKKCSQSISLTSSKAYIPGLSGAFYALLQTYYEGRFLMHAMQLEVITRFINLLEKSFEQVNSLLNDTINLKQNVFYMSNLAIPTKSAMINTILYKRLCSNSNVTPLIMFPGYVLIKSAIQINLIRIHKQALLTLQKLDHSHGTDAGEITSLNIKQLFDAFWSRYMMMIDTQTVCNTENFFQDEADFENLEPLFLDQKNLHFTEKLLYEDEPRCSFPQLYNEILLPIKQICHQIMQIKSEEIKLVPNETKSLSCTRLDSFIDTFSKTLKAAFEQRDMFLFYGLIIELMRSEQIPPRRLLYKSDLIKNIQELNERFAVCGHWVEIKDKQEIDEKGTENSKLHENDLALIGFVMGSALTDCNNISDWLDLIRAMPLLFQVLRPHDFVYDESMLMIGTDVSSSEDSSIFSFLLSSREIFIDAAKCIARKRNTNIWNLKMANSDVAEFPLSELKVLIPSFTTLHTHQILVNDCSCLIMQVKQLAFEDSEYDCITKDVDKGRLDNLILTPDVTLETFKENLTKAVKKLQADFDHRFDLLKKLGKYSDDIKKDMTRVQLDNVLKEVALVKLMDDTKLDFEPLILIYVLLPSSFQLTCKEDLETVYQALFLRKASYKGSFLLSIDVVLEEARILVKSKQTFVNQLNVYYQLFLELSSIIENIDLEFKAYADDVDLKVLLPLIQSNKNFITKVVTECQAYSLVSLKENLQILNGMLVNSYNHEMDLGLWLKATIERVKDKLCVQIEHLMWCYGLIATLKPSGSTCFASEEKQEECYSDKALLDDCFIPNPPPELCYSKMTFMKMPSFQLISIKQRMLDGMKQYFERLLEMKKSSSHSSTSCTSDLSKRVSLKEWLYQRLPLFNPLTLYSEKSSMVCFLEQPSCHALSSGDTCPCPRPAFHISGYSVIPRRLLVAQMQRKALGNMSKAASSLFDDALPWIMENVLCNQHSLGFSIDLLAQDAQDALSPIKVCTEKNLEILDDVLKSFVKISNLLELFNEKRANLYETLITKLFSPYFASDLHQLKSLVDDISTELLNAMGIKHFRWLSILNCYHKLLTESTLLCVLPLYEYDKISFSHNQITDAAMQQYHKMAITVYPLLVRIYKHAFSSTSISYDNPTKAVESKAKSSLTSLFSFKWPAITIESDSELEHCNVLLKEPIFDREHEEKITLFKNKMAIMEHALIKFARKIAKKIVTNQNKNLKKSELARVLDLVSFYVSQKDINSLIQTETKRGDSLKRSKRSSATKSSFHNASKTQISLTPGIQKPSTLNLGKSVEDSESPTDKKSSSLKRKKENGIILGDDNHEDKSNVNNAPSKRIKNQYNGTYSNHRVTNSSSSSSMNSDLSISLNDPNSRTDSPHFSELDNPSLFNLNTSDNSTTSPLNKSFEIDLDPSITEDFWVSSLFMDSNNNDTSGQNE